MRTHDGITVVYFVIFAKVFNIRIAINSRHCTIKYTYQQLRCRSSYANKVNSRTLKRMLHRPKCVTLQTVNFNLAKKRVTLIHIRNMTDV